MVQVVESGVHEPEDWAWHALMAAAARLHSSEAAAQLVGWLLGGEGAHWTAALIDRWGGAQSGIAARAQLCIPDSSIRLPDKVVRHSEQTHPCTRVQGGRHGSRERAAAGVSRGLCAGLGLSDLGGACNCGSPWLRHPPDPSSRRLAHRCQRLMGPWPGYCSVKDAR